MSVKSLPKSQLGPTLAATVDPVATAAGPAPRSGFRKGWLSFIAILVCTFCSALDLTAIATALPTITESLHGGDEFVWIGGAYGLSSTAILPLSGRFSDAFGRRPVMLAAVGLFFDMSMLIAGRSSSPARAGVQIAYAAIPVIKTLLQEPLRREVQDAFAESLKVVWQTTIGLCGVGLLSVGMMREVPMQKTADERYGLDENQNANARGGEARTRSEKLQGGAEVQQAS